MLNGVSGHVIKKLIYESHPGLDEHICINKLQKKIVCNLCKSACPNNAISGDVPRFDESLCEDCEMCSAVCPSGAINPSANHTARLVGLLENASGDVILGCENSNAECDIKLKCLASFPWEIIANLALTNKIYFAKGECDSCSKNNRMIFFERALKNAREFIGDEFYEKNISFDEFKSRTYTKREAINEIKNTGHRGIYTLLPESLRGQNDGRLWRRLLIAKCKGMGIGANLTVTIFNENCRACGLCERVCPGECIFSFKTEDGDYYMAHFAHKCSRCGVCEKTCIWNGISGFGDMYFENPDEPAVYKTTATSCEICGKPCGKEGICVACATKYKFRN